MLPTPAGHRLAQSAPQLLRELANAKTHVSQEGTAGELVIGTINTALHSLLPDILAGFVKKCPDAKVFLRSATTRELYEAVRQGELDAAVCLHPRSPWPRPSTGHCCARSRWCCWCRASWRTWTRTRCCAPSR